MENDTRGSAAPAGRLSAQPAAAIADALVDLVVDTLTRIVGAHVRDWRMPRLFAGRRVGADATADLAFTLGLLHAGGVEAVAGAAVPDTLSTLLRSIEGPRTHTFACYRVAETLARFGPFTGNPILDGWSDAERANLLCAVDAREAIARLDRLPVNFAAVLARCELARVRLGLVAENDPLLAWLVQSTAARMAAHPEGFVDDSREGASVYDIYTADVYLFSEPFAARLAPFWEHGLRSALRLAELTMDERGYCFPWGRSNGPLAACLTVELGALVLRDGFARRERWRTYLEAALRTMPGWFGVDGLVTAHRHCATNGYRGLHRLLQMTFDCLGKLAWSALVLRAAPDVARAPASRAFGRQDDLVWLDEPRRAGLWCYRGAGLSFVLPMVGTTRSDYLPVPRRPGLFEVPIETDVPAGVPTVHVGGVRFVPGERPDEVVKLPRGLRIRYDGYRPAGKDRPADPSSVLPGRRTVTYRVHGRTLHVDEDLQLAVRPDALGLQITETAGRPLRVEFVSPHPHAVTVVETAGLPEYRSFWSELPRAHEIDVEPATSVRLSYRVTPVLRVLGSTAGHRYTRTIYDAMGDGVRLDGAPPHGGGPIPSEARGEWFQRLIGAGLERWDVFHLQWPEATDFLGPDLDAHRQFIDRLRDAGIGVVWTQHNLEPHSKDARFAAIYAAWAACADAVIHHSRWGMEAVRARYRFRPDAWHRVIPHPCLTAMRSGPHPERSRLEAAFGLRPGRLRLGVVGAPRREKRVQRVAEAFAECGREDLDLLVFGDDAIASLPPHPRIVAARYAHMPREVFDDILATIDVLVLPFDREGMLTTGVVADAIAHGKPALASDWPFLAEVLGDAAIPYGSTREDLAARMRDLAPSALAAAAAAARALQARHHPARVARLTCRLLDAVAARHRYNLFIRHEYGPRARTSPGRCEGRKRRERHGGREGVGAAPEP